MAPKKSAREPTTAAVPATTPAKTTAAPALAPITEPTTTPAAPLAAAIPSTTGSETWDKVFQNLYSHYVDETPHRTKLLDIFLAFLTAVGALQFFYCILAGNYPFNAFLSGFGATVGQFVLTISLRMQTNEANKSEFPKVSPERAFTDYVFCSVILHFFCINFIN